MTNKTYKYRLMIHGKVVYENTIDDRSNPKDALSWGFYWMPSNWIQREKVAPIHADVCIVGEDGKQKPWKSYDNPYLEDASNIRNFNYNDLKCLVAGQTLVWLIVDKQGEIRNTRIFASYEAVREYIRQTIRLDLYPVHRWVDGWYDEQYSWQSSGVKGYDLSGWWKEDVH